MPSGSSWWFMFSIVFSEVKKYTSNYNYKKHQSFPPLYIFHTDE